jgi:5-formyltetrahydrofolate cyclo-ligase
MRALRQALPPAAVAARSARIVERVASLTPYEEAKSIALFWPIDRRNEVDLRPLDVAARAAGKRVYYPFMDRTESGYSTGFRLVTDPSTLVDRGRGFREPDPALAHAERGDIDLVIVPALAVSSDGHRLGYGAGFYDATLLDVRPPALAVVVAFDFGLLIELPVEEHDVACDGIVTDRRVMLEP